MNKEIENFIDLALADGQVTDKELGVILKKAIELGADPDEVEMILNGKLHQMEANRPKINEKAGSIKICPACGEKLKPLDIECSACGHNLTDVTVGSSLEVLRKGLLSVNNEVEKQELIKKFTPNKDKESIIDTLHYLLGQVVSPSPKEEELKTNDVLKQKSQEILSRSLIYFSNDEKFTKFIEDFNQNIDEKFSTTAYVLVVGKQKMTRSYLATSICLVFFFGVSFLLRMISPDMNNPQSMSMKAFPFWAIISAVLFCLTLYFGIEHKKHVKRFPFLENHK
jgi:hypothetical protein